MSLPVEARCVACGASYDPRGVIYTCEACEGTLDLLWDYADMRNRKLGAPEILHALYPIERMPASPDRLHIAAAPTPLLRAHRLRAELGIGELLLKDETRNASGSLKDRASEMVLRRAEELGMRTVATASTGNAGASLACLAARFGMEAVVFTPRSAPPAKLRQIQAHGATLYLVDGNYDLAYDLCLEAVRERGWYSRNTGHNPWCGEGKKSVVTELFHEMDKVSTWPDLIFVPTGDGCILGAVHKGLTDLMLSGLLDRMPRLVAVQAEGSAAIADAWREKREIRPVQAHTLADSIAVDEPRDGLKALRAVRETDGFAVTVSDSEILAALRDLARSAGIFAEPAAAATLAGIRKSKLEGLVTADDCVLAVITGNGLKDRDAILPLLEDAPVIASCAELP